MITYLVLKGLLVIDQLLVLVQETLFELIISCRICAWCLLRCLRYAFLVLALRGNFRLMLLLGWWCLCVLSNMLRLCLGSMDLFTALMMVNLKLTELVVDRHTIEGGVVLHLVSHLLH